ncbi:uncharacterized protein APUU_71058A [Aspergillus puulaauensis]|uniref:Secreted protein n=1 Tax=Aspergillus puulaauensis TaxID=1220207 RepID=A0A7R7XYY0_9EURO|nr:uncharacterized protein APUU_71058A [Aspergillus puulaauensis]BCS29488.1 hypothetical protein APUU_71058A [Aspergillus puulaauensis]
MPRGPWRRTLILMTILVLIQAEYQSTLSIDAATPDVSNLFSLGAFRSSVAPDGLGSRCLVTLYSVLAPRNSPSQSPRASYLRLQCQAAPLASPLTTKNGFIPEFCSTN